jgi:hypothetical protein
MYMKRILAIGTLLLFSPNLFALVAPPLPQQIPTLDNWGLVSIGAAVALAGVIALFRTRK